MAGSLARRLTGGRGVRRAAVSASRRVATRGPRSSAAAAARLSGGGALVGPAGAVRHRAAFAVRVALSFGERVRVVGSPAALGEWRAEVSLPMVWTDGDVWRAEAELDRWSGAERTFEFKYVVERADGSFVWAPGPNAVAHIQPPADAPPAKGRGRVRVAKTTSFGQSLVLVGSVPQLGAWDVEKGIPLEYQADGVWEAELPDGLDESDHDVEYKVVKLDSFTGEHEWQSGANWILPNRTVWNDTPIDLGDSASRVVHARSECWEPNEKTSAELAAADCLTVIKGGDFDPQSLVPLALPALRPPTLLVSNEEEEEEEKRRAQERAEEDANHEGVLTEALATLARPTLPKMPRLEDHLPELPELPESIKNVDMKTAASVSGAGAAAVTGAAAISSLGLGAELLDLTSVAGEPMLQTAAMLMIVGWGAKNTLFAEDRKKFLRSLTSRQAFEEFMVGEKEKDPEFDPLQMLAEARQEAEHEGHAGMTMDPEEFLSALPDVEAVAPDVVALELELEEEEEEDEEEEERATEGAF